MAFDKRDKNDQIKFGSNKCRRKVFGGGFGKLNFLKENKFLKRTSLALTVENT